MTNEITHRRDADDGHMVQIVSPERLREILDADGETYDPPSGFGPADEWDVASDMSATYYAVCNVNGPISVRLAAGKDADALAAFASIDGGSAIDDCSADAEDDLDISGEGMSESDFAAALEAAGAECIGDLDEVTNAHAGTVAHLSGGWALWRLDQS